MNHVLAVLLHETHRRWRIARAAGDAGYSTEAVVTIAVLVACALTALGIIVAAVILKSKHVDFG